MSDQTFPIKHFGLVATDYSGSGDIAETADLDSSEWNDVHLFLKEGNGISLSSGGSAHPITLTVALSGSAGSLFPNTDCTFDLGNLIQKWRNAYFCSAVSVGGTSFMTTSTISAGSSGFRTNATSTLASIIPFPNNIYDLGSSTQQWRHGFFANTVSAAAGFVTGNVGRDPVSGTIYAEGITSTGSGFVTSSTQPLAWNNNGSFSTNQITPVPYLELNSWHFASADDNLFDLGKSDQRWRRGFFGTSSVGSTISAGSGLQTNSTLTLGTPGNGIIFQTVGGTATFKGRSDVQGFDFDFSGTTFDWFVTAGGPGRFHLNNSQFDLRQTDGTTQTFRVELATGIVQAFGGSATISAGGGFRTSASSTFAQIAPYVDNAFTNGTALLRWTHGFYAGTVSAASMVVGPNSLLPGRVVNEGELVIAGQVSSGTGFQVGTNGTFLFQRIVATREGINVGTAGATGVQQYGMLKISTESSFFGPALGSGGNAGLSAAGGAGALFAATDASDTTGAAIHLATEWAFQNNTTTFARIATTGSVGIGFGTATFPLGGQLMSQGTISGGTGFAVSTSAGGGSMHFGGTATTPIVSLGTLQRAIPVVVNGTVMFLPLYASVSG